MAIVFLSVETTGISPQINDRIVEIAAVKVCDDDVENPSVFHKYINPERSIPAVVVRIHGINNAKVSDAPKFSEVAQDFLDFIEGCTLVVHNATFIIGFIESELSLCELPSLKEMQFVDVLHNARLKHPTERNNLDALAYRYDIENPDRTLHNALYDAQLLTKIYFSMGADKANALSIQTILLSGGERDQSGDSPWSMAEPTHESMTLRIGDFEMELGAECQERLADEIPDYPAYQELFGILAKSNNTAIRNSMASKQNLSEETVTLLLNDPDIEVVLSILEEDQGKTLVTNEKMLQLIQKASHKDIIRLTEIIDECVQINQEEITKAIFNLGDPSISIAYAASWNCAAMIRKNLVRFEDQDIRAAAQSH